MTARAGCFGVPGLYLQSLAGCLGGAGCLSREKNHQRDLAEKEHKLKQSLGSAEKHGWSSPAVEQPFPPSWAAGGMQLVQGLCLAAKPHLCLRGTHPCSWETSGKLQQRGVQPAVGCAASRASQFNATDTERQVYRAARRHCCFLVN